MEMTSKSSGHDLALSLLAQARPALGLSNPLTRQIESLEEAIKKQQVEYQIEEHLAAAEELRVKLESMQTTAKQKDLSRANKGHCFKTGQCRYDFCCCDCSYCLAARR